MRRSSSFDGWFVPVVVFVSGASVLAIEILGTRILGPFYGVSLYLWSALITVTLIALSVGYAIGGRWADRDAAAANLYGLLAGAGAWTLLIPWLRRPILALAEPFGLRLAVLVAAFLLFAPPLTLLGMVSPYAIRLRAARLEVVGRTAGDLYAISTVGSVVAALLTGFFLIPRFGVGRLTILIGVALLVVAAVGMVREQGWGAAGVPLLVAASGIAAQSVSPARGADPAEGLMVLQQSPYAEIRVLDHAGQRHLLIDGGVHTIVHPQTHETRYPYVAVLDVARALFDEPGTMALVGLGGGSVAKHWAADGWSVDAVEIDPLVVEVARDWFGLDAREAAVHVGDGRRFLDQADRRWDVIVLDAFGSSSIPFHLISREAFALAASRLSADGVLAINLETLGWHGDLSRAVVATAGVEFPHVLALPAHTGAGDLGNMIVLASPRPLDPGRPLLLDIAGPLGASRSFAWDNRFVPDTAGVPILTDDLTPVDLWSEAINLAARRDLHEYFAEDWLSW